MKSARAKPADSRRARSEATKHALMRAAEKLIAENGVENVSIREIVAAADQKNESALQYHFKNLSGLLSAIRTERAEQVRDKRAEQLDALLAEQQDPTLRQLCTLMVEPTFQLARSKLEFRRYIRAFGTELAHVSTSPLRAISGHGGGGESGERLGMLLRQALPHLDEKDYRRRMESAVLLCTSAMYHHANQKSAFRSDQSDLFLNALIDALCGLLGAPVSAETKAYKRKAGS